MIENILSKKIKIGHGATSVVYRVANCFAGKGYLAIKILNDIIFKKDEVKKSTKSQDKSVWGEENDFLEEESLEIDMNKMRILFHEYEILKNLNHPNIIKIYGFFFGDKNHEPAILLEYCRFNLEKAFQYLDNIDIVGVIYEICSAMMYIHKINLIHRDLKTTNILLDSNKHVKICDFGISRVMNLTSKTSLTHEVGTFHPDSHYKVWEY